MPFTYTKTVASVGGDYTSVYDAAIAVAALNPDSSHTALISISAETFTETQDIPIPQWTTVRGVSRNTTIVQNVNSTTNCFTTPGGEITDALGSEVRFENLSIIATKVGSHGVLTALTSDTGAKKVFFTDCYVRGRSDCFLATLATIGNLFLEADNTIFEGYGDGVTGNGVQTAGTPSYCILRNCTIIKLGGTNTTWAVGVKFWGNLNPAYLYNCTVSVTSTDTDATIAGGVNGTITMYGGSITVTKSGGTGIAYGATTTTGATTLNINNCKISVSTSNNAAATGVTSLSTGASTSNVNNCDITASSSGTGVVSGLKASHASTVMTANNTKVTTSSSGGGTVYDIYNSGAGTVNINNLKYDPSKVSGTITDITSIRRNRTSGGSSRYRYSRKGG